MAIPTVPGSWRGVVNRYNAAPEEVRHYFEPVPELIERYDWQVSISFMFARLEQAHNYLLYAGAVKIHRANSSVAHRYVDRQHITKKTFKLLFKNVIGVPIPREAGKILNEAEIVRNKIIHGKVASEADKRKAIVFLVEYATRINILLNGQSGFMPFKVERRGFAGRRQALESSTSTWLMRGLGFDGGVGPG